MLSGREHNVFDDAFFLEIEFDSVSSCRFFISAETNYIKTRVHDDGLKDYPSDKSLLKLTNKLITFIMNHPDIVVFKLTELATNSNGIRVLCMPNNN